MLYLPKLFVSLVQITSLPGITVKDVRKLCYNLPKIQEKRPSLSVFRQNDANEIANSEDPDQTAPRV